MAGKFLTKNLGKFDKLVGNFMLKKWWRVLKQNGRKKHKNGG